MSTASPQTKDKPIIEVALGENGGPIAFSSLQEAREWIDEEIEKWGQFQLHTDRSNPFAGMMGRQLRLPTLIKQQLVHRLHIEYFTQPNDFQAVTRLFERYADFESLCARSPLGEAILAMPGNRQMLSAIGGLASILGIPAHEALGSKRLDDSQVAAVLSGYALGRSNNVVKRSDLPEHRLRMEEQLGRLNDIIGQAKQGRDELDDTVTRSSRDLDEVLESQKSKSDQARASAQEQWESLRFAFEQELQLRAPASYWSERASTTQSFAMGALAAFVVLALVFIAVIVWFGPGFLERLAATGETVRFATLALVSVPALTALWILRHVARLFVTNLERSSDAKFRATMATTFLALTKEGTTEASMEERLLVLEALFRSPAPQSGDDGHWGGLAESLTRRKSQT